MDEKTFYTKILVGKPPWYVKEVVMDESVQRLDIYIEKPRHLWDYWYETPLGTTH